MFALITVALGLLKITQAMESSGPPMAQFLTYKEHLRQSTMKQIESIIKNKINCKDNQALCNEINGKANVVSKSLLFNRDICIDNAHCQDNQVHNMSISNEYCVMCLILMKNKNIKMDFAIEVLLHATFKNILAKNPKSDEELLEITDNLVSTSTNLCSTITLCTPPIPNWVHVVAPITESNFNSRVGYKVGVEMCRENSLCMASRNFPGLGPNFNGSYQNTQSSINHNGATAP